MAVLLYARATQTNANRRGNDGSRERGPSQIRDQLSPSEQADHDTIVDVRSQALAHVYQNEAIAGFEWHSGATLLVETEDGWLPGAASRRVILSPAVIATLSRLLPRARGILEDRTQQRFSEVATAFTEARGPELDALLSSCWLDKNKFFGSELNATLALNGVIPGRPTMFSGDV